MGTVTISSNDLNPTTVSADGAGLQSGQKVTLGIRPHALRIDPEGSVTGRIGFVERLGSETNVSITLGSGISWLAVLEGDADITTRQTLKFSFSQKDTMLFSENGLARSIQTTAREMVA
jgi:multiple sugar transport system ATP-binding protein